MHSGLKTSKYASQVVSHPLVSLDPTQRAWIEVSGQSIEHNVRSIKSLLKKGCQFMAVVKADGYGHGAKFVSQNAIKGGADKLGVATLQEGLNLRSEGIREPILVLGNIYKRKDLLICFQNNLMPTISDIQQCIICNQIGEKYKKLFYVHLKIDTGMSRLGFDIKNFIQHFENIISFENIMIDGIYSHLSTADALDASHENSYANIQRRTFLQLLSNISINKYPNITTHLANSAGILIDNNFHFDMVRVGLCMYGYKPSQYQSHLKLKPAMSLKSKVSFIRIVDNNVGISYGKKFITSKKTKLAVISIGYADGIYRNLSNKISLIHNGKKYPQIGSITMDQLMIDITGANDINVGDTVTLLGCDSGQCISPVDWADAAETIPWEILCAFKNRLPRVQI